MDSEAAFDHGYFVDPDDEEDVEAEAEPRERYAKGLYYPVQIGDTLDSRYRIEHKLGWGGYSTVWLAHDTQQDKAVALKILISGEGQAERCVQSRNLEAVQDPSRLVMYQAAFSLLGVEGTYHMVLVFPLRGPSLRATLYYMSPVLRMSAAKHSLLALKSLHDAGFVHKGELICLSYRQDAKQFLLADLNMGNVMWHIESVDHWTTAEIYQQFGRPRKATLPEARGKLGELVEPMRVPIDVIRSPVYLGDFGHTFNYRDAVENTVQFPLSFCAPERLHGTAPSFASDMWSYTSIFASLYIGADVLWGNGIECISRVVGMAGPFPEHWRSCYSGGDVVLDWWYDHDGQVAPPKMPLDTLEKKIAHLRPEVNSTERNHVLSLIHKGWCYLPEHRITAAELLEDLSFKALMAIYGV
jgi:serine/threonine protein kinase